MNAGHPTLSPINAEASIGTICMSLGRRAMGRKRILN
jgi:hypothetical protein